MKGKKEERIEARENKTNRVRQKERREERKQKITYFRKTNKECMVEL
jgi:hypothetical protein